MRRFVTLWPEREKVPSVMAQIAWTRELRCGTSLRCSVLQTRRRCSRLPSSHAGHVYSCGYAARRAAERALAQLAPTEAARWYRQALELHDQAAGGDRIERCDLLIGLGEAQCQTGDPEFRQTLLDAAHLAQALEDADRLSRAVLANSRGWWSQAGAVDSGRVHALEVADEALADDDPRRAQVLALLANELHFAGEPARCRALAGEAIAIARAAGDPATLAHTLLHASWAIWVPDTLRERQRMTDELVELAQHLDDPRLRFLAASRQWNIGAQVGDRGRVSAGLETMRAMGARMPDPTVALAAIRG